MQQTAAERPEGGEDEEQAQHDLFVFIRDCSGCLLAKSTAGVHTVHTV